MLLSPYRAIILTHLGKRFRLSSLAKPALSRREEHDRRSISCMRLRNKF
jgi:hypothetical protein